MINYVFDSYTLLSYLEKEKNWDKVSNIIKNALAGELKIFFSFINWGEVYYIAFREGGKKRAELYCRTIAEYPINIVTPDRELTIEAAKLKASYKISYADAFAASLSKQKKAILLTGDKEFQQLKNIIKINWI